MTLVRWAVLAGAVIPLIYYLVALLCGVRFFRRRGRTSAGPAPAVSVLKPVHGLDREAYENFASFCRQKYPQYEMLFCVAAADEPSIPVIRKVMQDFPGVAIRLLIGYEHLGANDKVNKLCRMVRESTYDLLVISDSDIRVNPDHLQELTAGFNQNGAGAVTSVYVGAAEPHLWPELEAINLSSSFMPGVLVAQRLEGIRFALGATIAITRDRLREIGGFEVLADSAADDFEIGKRVAARGHRVELSRSTVQTMCSSATLGELFERQLRWAIVLRHSRPGGHLGWALTQGLPWSLGAIMVSHSAVVAAAYVGAYLTLRLAMAWTVGVWGLGDGLLRRRLWLVPFGDALGFLAWALSLVSNRINWRGNRFEVRDGRLVPVSSARTAASQGSARAAADS